MSTLYLKKDKMPGKIICLSCKKRVELQNNGKCNKCNINDMQSIVHTADRLHYWSGSEKRTIPIECKKIFCGSYGKKKLVYPVDRKECFECFVNEYYDV
jgi:hypothetical protein